MPIRHGEEYSTGEVFFKNGFSVHEAQLVRRKSAVLTRALASLVPIALPLPDEFDETRANTLEKSRADERLGVLGIIAPAGR
ncbi:hypothetical protein [Cochlodiniinecator piscidefendens]|uniref:hypothetical protein n=1 Tax=Cochlodiniinecator piscidefendens TaxID=2715756 RepID=UPI00197B8B75|nr:hypothetical protein [Cochlodiniinecator piscidefendens]